MNSSLERRRVHFVAEKDTISEIETDYSEEETLNYWFTEIELTKIAVRSLKEGFQLDKSSSSSEEEEIYFRGLEVSTTQGKEVHDTAIRQCVDAVMDEQEAQWDIDIEDYNRIAYVSQEVSASSTAFALERAKQDALEAQRIYQSSSSIRHQSKDNSKADVYKKPIHQLDDVTSACSDLSLTGLDSVNSSRHSLVFSVGSSMEMEHVLTSSDEDQEDRNDDKETSKLILLQSNSMETDQLQATTLGDSQKEKKGQKLDETIQSSNSIEMEQVQSSEDHQEDGNRQRESKHQLSTLPSVTADEKVSIADKASSTPKGNWHAALRIGGLLVVASSLLLLYHIVGDGWTVQDTRGACLELASDILLYPASSV